MKLTNSEGCGPMQVATALLIFAVSAVSAITVQDSPSDSEPQASEFQGADLVQAHSKYFQYAHVPHKDHYEVGHRRGNDHHFIERHEKAHPHAGEFKTKVRWGDKKGGYGEHYWDYNHDGHDHHHDASDEGTEQSEQIAEYDEQPQQRPRLRRNDQEQEQPQQPSYAFDPETGHVVDQNTGRYFALHPVY